jgi:5-methyltetrahydrofolate--homocysteine methyltransferase
MNREEFKRLAAEEILFLDGATGTNLSRAGMPAGVCPEQWVLSHPRALVDLQRGYIRAGSDILYAPTFSANRIKLMEYGLYPQMEEMIEGLVALSKQAVEEELGHSSVDSGKRRVYVAGDLTMTGELLVPLGRMAMDELVEIYKEQIGYLVKAGVDLLVVETMMSLNEARAALLAAREVCELPVMVTMTFEQSGRTLFGTDAETAAVVLESLGASAIGANCSSGPKEMEALVRRMAGVTNIPVIAKPNAGLPKVDEEGQTYFDMSAEVFGEEMKELVKAGATILGGCCGTDPSYIETLKNILSEASGKVGIKEWYDRNQLTRRPAGRYYLASERQTHSFGVDDGFFLIGERINPTGKKKLQGQLREGSMELVRQFAREQEEMGARVLDVNMGMGGVSEVDLMLQAIQEIGEISNLPLSLDSSSPEVIEAALRHYPGRALVNSVSLEPEKIEKLLPIVAKYGAVFILLPLSEKGLPENLDEKKEIIRTIMERAYALGMSKEDIIVDGLVTTIGANKHAALETLETISFCKELGMATVCGLSNISFGMPNRAYINGAFLTLAIGAGLTMAIANPSQNFVKGLSLGTDLLLGKEGADLRYIEEADAIKDMKPGDSAINVARNDTMSKSGAITPTMSKPGASNLAVSNSDVNNLAVSNQGASNPAMSDPGTNNLALSNSVSSKPSISDPGTHNFAMTNFAGSNPTTPDTVEGILQGDDPRENESKFIRIMEDAVLKGNRGGIVELTNQALAAGLSPEILLQEALLPAIRKVGELFEKGKYFLPQLIASAEAMKHAVAVLEPLLITKGDEMHNRPVVIIATVEGDIHDIGKNLVALLLKNNGFQVVDLGKDVKGEAIVEAAKVHCASVIALSALMTTTMQKMKDFIALAKSEGLDAKIIIGGAVVTKEYADEIGADGYSKDAAGAVHLVESLCLASK